MLRDELRGEARDRVRIGEHGECAVLGLVVGAAGLALHDESALSRSAPVGRAFEADAPVENAALGVADRVRRRLADDDVRVEGGGVFRHVRVEDGLLVLAA
jgi:hypothetical protein